jgi:hypothetical protein
VVAARLLGMLCVVALAGCTTSMPPRSLDTTPSTEPTLRSEHVEAARKQRVPQAKLAADTTKPPPVLGGNDQEQIRAIGTLPIQRVSLARGGRSVAFKVTFEDGSQALYKPEQSFAANWYSELASYHLDRALGLGRVPPAVGRALEWSRLAAAASKSPHADEVVLRADGSVRGAMMYWLTEDLVPLSPPPGWEAWLRVTPLNGVSPFQRQEEYQRALRQFEAGKLQARPTEPVPPPERADRPAELSDLIVFDYLIGNHDRWGGGFTNVRTLGKAGPLIAIDNASAFPRASAPPNKQSQAKLLAVQRFRTRTVQALERLTLDQLESALTRDPLAPLLSKEQLAELWRRRARVLAHVRENQKEFGDKALAWY